MAGLASFVSGRKTKWVVLAIWIVAVFICLPIGAKVADIVDDRQEAFLPKDAQSTQVIKLQKSEFRGGQTVNALVIYQRPGGLQPSDRAKIAALERAAAGKLPVVTQPSPPLLPP